MTADNKPEIRITDREVEIIGQQKQREIYVELVLGQLSELAGQIEVSEPIFYPNLDVYHQLKVHRSMTENSKSWGYKSKWWYSEYGIIKVDPPQSVIQKIRKKSNISPVLAVRTLTRLTDKPEIECLPLLFYDATIYRRDLQEVLVNGLTKLVNSDLSWLETGSRPEEHPLLRRIVIQDPINTKKK